MEETIDPPASLLPPASRSQTKALETQLLGGERTLKRRDVAAGAGGRDGARAVGPFVIDSVTAIDWAKEPASVAVQLPDTSPINIAE